MMIDRKKVIDALRNCINRPKCQDCPWNECEEFHEKVELPKGLVMNMYDLLTKQEETEQELRHDLHDAYDALKEATRRIKEYEKRISSNEI